MKKIMNMLLIVIMLITCCSCTMNENNYDKNSAKSSTTESSEIKNQYSEDIILPKTTIESADLGKELKKISISNFSIMEQMQDRFFGVKTINDPTRKELKTFDWLVDDKTNGEIPLKYPTGFPDWSVGSGSFVVLQNRFYYEWRSYTSQMEDQTRQKMKLTCLDSKTGKVSVVDEKILSTPFIYLCKIDDEHFLSFYACKDDPNKKEYATLSVAEIYDINGNKKTIVNEKYENQEDWNDSKGLLLERFSVNNGKIYGFGRRRISGDYKFYLYNYDTNGKLLKTEQINGFENVIKDEQPVEFWLINNYIVFRTFESLTSYICKRTENGIDVIAKGANGRVSYCFIGRYILFMESNVNDDDTIISTKKCPLYMLDTKSDKLRSFNVTVPIDNPYFVDFRSLSDSDLLITYCEGKYEPLKQMQFILPGKTLKAAFENN